MMKLFTFTLFIGICLFGNAQAPVNDEPCGAIEIPVLPADPISIYNNEFIVYNFINATGSIGILNPSCNYGGVSSNIKDVWYKFLVPASGRLFIRIVAIENHNFTFYTATTCSGVLTEVACFEVNAFLSGGNSHQFANLTPGSFVYLRGMKFTSFTSNSEGNFSLSANDFYNNLPMVDNSTKVGIGTTQPLAKLDVAGTGIFRDTVIFAKAIDLRNGLKFKTGAANGSILTSDANGIASWAVPAPLPPGANVWSVSGNNISNSNSGNVGIGTPTPLNKLTVSGSANLTGNLGIGESNPGFPLTFATPAVGDKISLFGNSGNHYGFGVQSKLLQIHSAAATDNIAFGHGSSAAFTERATIINSGTEGMNLKGRLHLLNGSSPIDVAQAGGVWLYKADNSNLLSFMGTQNNQNVGFFGGPGNSGWGFVYDAINSRVGIGKDNPTSLLNVNGQVTIDQNNFGGYGGLLIKGNTPINNYPNIGFSVKNTANADVVGALVQGELVSNSVGGEAIDLGFYTTQTGFSGLSQNMIIKGNGNVGVGVSPSYKLHLGNAANGLRIEGPSASGTGASSLSVSGNGDVLIDRPGIVGGRLTIKENGNIGIGQNNPGFPLNFANTLGDKISLWGNTGSHYGFGVQGGTLQIHAGVASDDIALGYGNSAAFTEKFRFKGNGAMVINGNTGNVGRVLTSQGAGSSPTWEKPIEQSSFTNSGVIVNAGSYTVVNTTTPKDVIGSAISVNVPAGGANKLYISADLLIESGGCSGLGCSPFFEVQLWINGVEKQKKVMQINNNVYLPISFSNVAFDVLSGVQNIKLTVNKVDDENTALLYLYNITAFSFKN
jgi:hypothetical protein